MCKKGKCVCRLLICCVVIEMFLPNFKSKSMISAFLEDKKSIIYLTSIIDGIILVRALLVTYYATFASATIYQSLSWRGTGQGVVSGEGYPDPETGCKESQFYSLPFRQAVASIYYSPQAISTT